MFNRDNLFGNRQPPPPGGARPPQQPPNVPTRSPQPDPRYQQQRQPYDQEKFQRNGDMRQTGRQLRPAKSPDNSFTFGNISAVNPEDLGGRDRGDAYILVNGQYVVTARPLSNFPRGQISLSDAQRTWMQVALTDLVEIVPYDPFSQGANSYLTSMDVEVGFAGKKSTDVTESECPSQGSHRF